MTQLAKMLSKAGGQKFKRQNLEGWLGGSMPTLPAVQAVLKTFPGLRPEWVTTGERPRTRVSEEATEAARAAAAEVRARLIALADQLSEDYGLEREQSAPEMEADEGEATGPEGDTAGMQGAIDAAKRAAARAARSNRRRA